MVSIADKTPTKRTAKAVCTVRFTDEVAIRLIQENQMKKGDVLGVARIAGIMAAKRTPDLIPLCHPIAISKVSVDVFTQEGRTEGAGVDTAFTMEIEATVSCEGKTGVEMEALTAASTAALTVYDMCKAVDKGWSSRASGSSTRKAVRVGHGLRVFIRSSGSRHGHNPLPD
ncbi:Molybdenum cofactor biosynthesis protein 1 [Apiospora arundinis]